MLPIYIEIPYKDPIHYYEIFHDKPWSCFFDGGPQYSDYSQYSFLAIDPFATLVSKDGIIEFNSSTYTEDPFNFLEVELARYVMPTHSHLPPFQGGVAGHFAYDLRYHLEELPSIAIDDMHFSDMALGFYDLVLAFDLQQCKAWAISNGFPFVNEAKRRYRAEKRLQWLKNHIQGMHQQQRSSGIFSIPKNQVKSNFSRLDYEKAVKDVIKYILEGDVFEVNISQRFKAKISMEFNTFDLYQCLRSINQSPFSAYINYGDEIIASTSPERFLKVTDRLVTTRPIKGTRPRHQDKIKDKQLANELQSSEKDHAENVMIVDLMRNDLSKVCEDGSISVPQLCTLESYETVHHLVSTVTGKLKNECSAIDLIRSTFPGGSITGAPKIRAMEIIEELEPTRRGPYCGSVAYIGFDGCIDSSIIIRTFAIKNNTVTYQAGGAVVSDSDPEMEYKETLHKAFALTKSLTGDKKTYDIID